MHIHNLVYFIVKWQWCTSDGHFISEWMRVCIGGRLFWP